MAKSQEELMVLLGRESAKFSRAFSRVRRALAAAERARRACIRLEGRIESAIAVKEEARLAKLAERRVRTVRPQAGRQRSSGCQTPAIAGV